MSSKLYIVNIKLVKLMASSKVYVNFWLKLYVDLSQTFTSNHLEV